MTNRRAVGSRAPATSPRAGGSDDPPGAVEHSGGVPSTERPEGVAAPASVGTTGAFVSLDLLEQAPAPARDTKSAIARAEGARAGSTGLSVVQVPRACQSKRRFGSEMAAIVSQFERFGGFTLTWGR